MKDLKTKQEYLEIQNSKQVLLTGKCKEEFEIYCITEIRKLPNVGSRFFDDTILKEFEGFLQTFKTSLIIDWFDTLKDLDLFINKWSDDNWQYSIDDGNIYPSEMGFKTRQEATNQAILKANELFNDSFQKYNTKFNKNVIL